MDGNKEYYGEMKRGVNQKHPKYEEYLIQEAQLVEQWLATPEEMVAIRDAAAERRWALAWGDSQEADDTEHVPLMDVSAASAPIQRSPKRTKSSHRLEDSQCDEFDDLNAFLDQIKSSPVLPPEETTFTKGDE